MVIGCGYGDVVGAMETGRNKVLGFHLKAVLNHRGHGDHRGESQRSTGRLGQETGQNKGQSFEWSGDLPERAWTGRIENIYFWFSVFGRKQVSWRVGDVRVLSERD